MATEEELALRRRRMKMKVARDRAQPAAEEPEQSTLDKARGAIQSFTGKGQLLGFGDEIVGGARALIDYPMSLALEGDVGDQTFGERYRMYRDDERAVQEQFADENKKTALALTMAGGLATPANKIPGGLGGASRQAQLGRAAAEGAAVGIGEAEELADIQDEGLLGAATAAGTNVALGTVGKALGKTAFARRVQENLTDPATGEFKPIHLAAEPGSLTGAIYRQTVGRIPGAQQKLQAQEAPFVRRATDALDAAKEGVRRNVDAENLRAGRERALAKTRADARGVRINEGLDTAVERATQRADDVTGNAAQAFRRTAATEAIPPHARDVLDGVDLDNPAEARQVISNWWQNNGFEEVKQTTFPWSGKGIAKELQDDLKRMIDDDPQLQIALGNVAPQIKRLSRRVGGGTPTEMPIREGMSFQELMELIQGGGTADIDGEALMAIRNVFATGANGSSKNGYALRQVANRIDDFIRGNMDDAAVDAFNNNITHYTKGLAYMDATRTKAAREAAGAFTPSQYMTAAGKYGGKGMSLKQAPLEDAARAANKTGADAKAALPGAKKRYQKAAARARRQNTHEKQVHLDAATKREQMAKSAAAASKRPGGAIYEAEQGVKDLARQTVPETASGLSQLLTAEVAGGIIPGRPPSRFARMAKGVGVGELLATEGMQRAMAGQTQLQQRMRAALLRGDFAEYNRLMARMAAMGATGE